MSTQDEVRKASGQFYSALNHLLNGDVGPMAEIWSHSDAVTTMHPTGDMDAGSAEVSEAWERISRMFSDGEVQLCDRHIVVADDMAFEVGIERGTGTLGGNQVTIRQRTTNVYRREDGAWRIVHHHADAAQQMLDVMGHFRDETA